MANSLRLARERDETINNVERVLFGMIHRRADGLKNAPSGARKSGFGGRSGNSQSSINTAIGNMSTAVL
jgi:hypothetical protein